MSASNATSTEVRSITVALVGNPNTGKTTLFNALTGFRQHVGNYPGVTVEKKTGLLRGCAGQRKIELIDLPGAYGLAAQSADETVVLDVLLGRQASMPAPDLIVTVVDATNIARNLFLVSQVLEIGKPVVVALNMIDLARASGVRIDCDKLAEALGAPVVPVVATKRRGMDHLTRAIESSVDAAPAGRHPSFPASVDAELDGLVSLVASRDSSTNGALSRVALLQTLLDPGGYHETAVTRQIGGEMADDLRRRRDRIIQAGESIAEVEGQVRYAWIDGIVGGAVTRVRPARRSKSEQADRVLTHRFVGLGVLLVIMGICFQSIYAWAAPLMDAVDTAIAAVGALISGLLPAGALQSLVVNGMVAGVGAVLVFLPQILILFLFLAIVEDCGYMSRAALLLDRWMTVLGLSGKSLIPLVSSFACAVPGVMATRTIEDRRSRFVTMMIAPLMSCSARLPVYTLLIAAFVPATPLLGGLIGVQALTMLAMYLLGAGVAVVVAFVLKHTLLKGAPQPFLMELPAYKWPSARTVVFRMYEQGREFCVSAGTIIFAVAIVIWALGYYPHPTAIGIEHDLQRRDAELRCQDRLDNINASMDSSLAAAAVAERDALMTDIGRREAGKYLRQSLLGRMGMWIEPVVKPLGWDWRIGTAAIASFPAREIVVATIGTIYNLGGDQDETSSGLREKLREAKWPDGRPVFNVAVALSVMVFFSLCCQCGATLAAIRRETNSWRWPLFTFSYMTTLAYVAALVTYQVAIRVT